MTPILDHAFNALTVEMSNSVLWEPFDGEPYSNFEEMATDYRIHGRILISTLHSENSIYGDPHVNHCARAWHDYCHILENASFDATGERKAAQLQIRQMLHNPLARGNESWFASILDCEVNGQVDYYMKHNCFPANGYEFTRERLGI
jgi:hypothetical protein